MNDSIGSQILDLPKSRLLKMKVEEGPRAQYVGSAKSESRDHSEPDPTGSWTCTFRPST